MNVIYYRRKDVLSAKSLQFEERSLGKSFVYIRNNKGDIMPRLVLTTCCVLELLVLFGKKKNCVKVSQDFQKYHFDLV